jgi:tetratricopeptide (TPR) repeat protein
LAVILNEVKNSRKRPEVKPEFLHYVQDKPSASPQDDIQQQFLRGADRGRVDASHFHRTRTIFAFAGTVIVAMMFSACNSEVLQKQAEQLKEQEQEIARQRQEIDALLAAQKTQEQQRRDCNRAFREFFDKAQLANDRDSAIALYRDGLALCPDDDVAHYELGKVLAEGGRYQEAEQEFEAALKINPGFGDAKKQLESVRGRK